MTIYHKLIWGGYEALKPQTQAEAIDQAILSLPKDSDRTSQIYQAMVMCPQSQATFMGWADKLEVGGRRVITTKIYEWLCSLGSPNGWVRRCRPDEIALRSEGNKVERVLWYRDLYLNTRHWQRFRASTLHPTCACCTRQAEQLHHRHYDSLAKEQPKDVTSLCPDCHAALEKVMPHRVPPIIPLAVQELFDREGVKWQ